MPTDIQFVQGSSLGGIVLFVVILTTLIKAGVVERFTKNGPAHDAAIIGVNLALSLLFVVLRHLALHDATSTLIDTYINEAFGVALGADKAFDILAHLGLSIGGSSSAVPAPLSPTISLTSGTSTPATGASGT